MSAAGGCHCAAIRYTVEGKPDHSVLCHCEDCRRCSGAPVVGWTAFPADGVTVTKGEPAIYASSEHGRRHFCARCGTGLFYENAAALPGIIDVQTATLDDPELYPAEVHIQVADRIGWMRGAEDLPQFDRYPEG